MEVVVVRARLGIARKVEIAREEEEKGAVHGYYCPNIQRKNSTLHRMIPPSTTQSLAH